MLNCVLEISSLISTVALLCSNQLWNKLPPSEYPNQCFCHLFLWYLSFGLGWNKNSKHFKHGFPWWLREKCVFVCGVCLCFLLRTVWSVSKIFYSFNLLYFGFLIHSLEINSPSEIQIENIFFSSDCYLLEAGLKDRKY